MIPSKYKISRAQNTNLYVIEHDGRGSISKTLRGGYTSHGMAQNAIIAFEQANGKKNVKTNNSD
tara:strand:+ start:381 stop:572 length:192 start_codon:yes stop_codon:yes gene_type:complete